MESRMNIRFLDVDTSTMHCGKSQWITNPTLWSLALPSCLTQFSSYLINYVFKEDFISIIFQVQNIFWYWPSRLVLSIWPLTVTVPMLDINVTDLWGCSWLIRSLLHATPRVGQGHRSSMSNLRETGDKYCCIQDSRILTWHRYPLDFMSPTKSI